MSTSQGEPVVSEVEIRYTTADDGPYLEKWLLDPETLPWFPMSGPEEVEDSVKRWISFSRFNCSITAVYRGEPCGLATLYLQPYRKIAHQCEFGIVVSNEFRNLGVGAELLKNLMHLAKNYFNIELLHLQVYAENPAIRLYKRFGFKEFGRQTHWLKDGNTYVARVFMERLLD